jgi:hypothetical protein
VAQEAASTLARCTAAAAVARADWDRGVAAFRADHQGRAGRREWGLSRPDGLRLERPARVGDNDPRCGPASMQQFDGEDLMVGWGLVCGWGPWAPGGLPAGGLPFWRRLQPAPASKAAVLLAQPKLWHSPWQALASVWNRQG